MIYEKHGRYVIPFYDVPAARAVMPEIEVEERRGNFTEVETGFPEEIAVQEAKRCLSCRRCLGCALCWAECKPEAIDFSIPDEQLELEFDEIILTSGQQNAFQALPSDLGYAEHPHVITDLQFERMLSPSGPTDGMVLSPLNGEVPGRIAILQAHPAAGEEHLLASSVLGVNMAILTLHKAVDTEVLLIGPLTEQFQQRFGSAAAAVKGLHLIEGTARGVAAAGEQRALQVTYSDGQNEKQATVDLVVLLTLPKVDPQIQQLGRKLELPIS